MHSLSPGYPQAGGLWPGLGVHDSVTSWPVALVALAALGVGALARLAGALTAGGAAAAAAVGSAVLAAGGLLPAAALLAFFVSSSLLSRLGRSRKAGLQPRISKGGARDAWQVLANGGVAALLSLAHAGLSGPGWLAGALGALAAANADTWATELGVLAGQPPRLITSGRPVDRGTSGAVTAQGLLASLAGAGLIGSIAALGSGWGAGLAIAAAGTGGSALDSLLGATVQAGYFCPACQSETERHPRHTCGGPTHQVKGLRWLGNDLVNFLATAAGALLGAGLWAAFGAA